MRQPPAFCASKADGKVSRGPVTPEGKAISSKNAVKHDLLINSALLPGEDRKEFRKVLAREIIEHEPENPVEHQLVQKLALFQWRQMRLWAMQHGGHSGEIRNQEGNPPPLLDRDMAYRAYMAFKEMHMDRRCMENMHRYEMSYLRQYHFVKKELLALQARRGKSERT